MTFEPELSLLVLLCRIRSKHYKVFNNHPCVGMQLEERRFLIVIIADATE
jgi:hypothetical protein